MNRNEIEKKYLWDLSDLYADDAAWETDFKKGKAEIQTIVQYKGRLTESADTLYEALRTEERVSRLLTNLITYAHLKLDENTKGSTYQAMYSRMEAVLAEAGEAGAFFEPELLSADESKIKQLLEDERLKVYGTYFDRLFRKKPHVLDEAMEGVLAQVGELAGTAGSAYEMLLNADMMFEDAVDSNGKTYKLTNASYIPLVMKGDRALRKDAFEKYYKTYEGHVNTIAALMQGEVKQNIFFAKMRKHSSARAAALFSNFIPTSVPDSLIEAVHDNLETFYKYMRLRKRALGVEELHMYDLYTPIVQDLDFEIPYEEACKTVLEMTKVLGSDYQQTIQSAFDSRWIDVYETEGKRSGAYSWGTYDSKPYVLLNHKDDLDSMFTLAHELGHSMHSYLSRKTQPYLYSNYSIFVAEVASTTNEALLNAHLLNTLKDPEKRKYVLNHYLDQFKGTIFRQTMFAEFERDIHAHVEAGGALTAEFMCEHYLALNKKYYGPDVVVDEAIQYEWARIPHFFMNFYVYQYATGFSAAISLADQILKEGDPAVKRYLEFLSSGSSLEPIEVLRRAGADMETEAPVANAMKVFKSVVDELEGLF